MNELVLKVDKKDTITSLELLEQINIFREQDGNRIELGHNDLLKVIRDEFEEEISLGNFSQSTYINERGREYPMFILTLAQAKQELQDYYLKIQMAKELAMLQNNEKGRRVCKI